MDSCEVTGREIMPPECNVEGLRTIRQGDWVCFAFGVRVPFSVPLDIRDTMALCVFGRFSDDGTTLLEWTTEDPCGFISRQETQV